MFALPILAVCVAAPPAAPTADRFGDPLPPGAIARIGSSRLRHPDRPLCLAFLPGGRRLVSGGTDGTLRVWAVADGRELRSFRVKDGTVSALAVSADGKCLAAHFYDEQVRLLDPETLAQTGSVRVPSLDSLSLSADGAVFSGVTLGNKVLLREAANGLDRLDLPEGRAAVLSPDGKAVAVAGLDDFITIYDVLSGEPRQRVRHLSHEGVTAVTFAPDGKQFATADTGPTAHVRVWEFGKVQPVSERVAEGPVAFLGGGRLLTRSHGAVAVWGESTRSPLRTFGTGVNTFAASADGKVVATAGAGARIAVWNTETGEELRPNGDGFGANTGLFPAGRGLLLVGANSVARWFPVDPLPVVVCRSNEAITATAARPELLLTAGPGRVSLWGKRQADIISPAPTRSIEFPGASFTASALSSDGTRGVIGSDAKRVYEFDPRSGTRFADWSTPGTPLALAYLPDPSRIAVVGRDGYARVWDRAAPPEADGTPAVAWKARVPRSLRAGISVSPDGRLVAVTSVVRVDVFDATTGRREFGIERKWEDGPFQCVAFSQDGRLLAAGAMGSAGSVTLWEVATRSMARRFSGGNGTVARVAFLPDGRHLASAGLDDNVLVWDTNARRGNTDPSAADLATAWNSLLRLDAAVGTEAVWMLAAAGPRGVAAIRDGLKDATATGVKIRDWVADLDAPAFAVRENAQRQLTATGLLALPAVTTAAEASTSPEVRQRARAILSVFERTGERIPDHGLYAEPLRAVRAVWALELIGGKDARTLLEQIRNGKGPAASEAAGALKRLEAHKE